MTLNLDETIRKLQMLRDLLQDPYIAGIARSYLAQSVESEAHVPVAENPDVVPVMRKKRRIKGKRGGLKKKAFEIVRRSTAPLTAKDVAELMESEGFSFEAQDKFIAVSKALRSLARETKIHPKPGEKPKAAIKYSRLPSLVPVQGEMTH